MIVRGDALGNSLRANEFEFNRQLNKIGKPVDRSEWGMTPPTVNAYYNPQENNINFPAGILQPPFYEQECRRRGELWRDRRRHRPRTDARLRRLRAASSTPRAICATGGRRRTAKRSTSGQQCFVDEYDSFVAVDDVHVNGKLTLGENTADNGGLRIAYMALLDVLANSSGEADRRHSRRNSSSSSAVGQIWCESERPEYARMLAQVNAHSPGKFRVNGVVGNMPEFQKAFGCKADAPMVRKPACRVW